MTTATTRTAQEQLAELQAERARLEEAGASFAELADNSAKIRELVFLAAGMGVSGGAGAQKAADPAPNGTITWEMVPPATAEQREYLAPLVTGNVSACGGGCSCPPPPPEVEDEVAATLAYINEPARRAVELDAVIDEALVSLAEHRAIRLGTLGTTEQPTPAGRYAVGDHVYRVDVPTDGPWAGTVGLYRVPAGEAGEAGEAGAAGAKVSGKRKREILETIAADAISTLRGYGKITGRCGGCDKTLSGLADKYGAHAACLARM